MSTSGAKHYSNFVHQQEAATGKVCFEETDPSKGWGAFSQNT